ncbi:MAG: glycoside hydrolase family 76 protein [Dysgonamonadaceae bacterium]|jgi:rhamnogalacturonyl hydrolase YesR|nr:glycoside hydrolase family 76 protein [Dysgonamonadaceae bacterium]
MKKIFWLSLFALSVLYSCTDSYPSIEPLEPIARGSVDTAFMSRAERIFERIFQHYWSDKVELMYGSYPNTLGTSAEPNSPQHDIHAYLWGFGGVYSAFSAIAQHTPDENFRRTYEERLKKSLNQYMNTHKNPAGYGCFVFDYDERLYDDAIWVGLDLTDLYRYTKENWYLDNAKIVWNFIMSGKDNVQGGGIYWKEAPKESKNTCVNAPAVALAVKLYQATGDETYLSTAKELYQWTKQTLQDPSDYLYWDNINVSGAIETAKFSYNSGQMIQSGVLLYNSTGDAQYLNDAKAVAAACYSYFFESFESPFSGEQFTIIKDGSLWFNAVMVRGFAELNQIEQNGVYMTAIRKSLEHSWKYAQDEDTGLFNSNMSGNNQDAAKDILYQGAIAEMFARVSIR